MNFEVLIGIAIFTEKALTWSDANEAIKIFAQTGTPVPKEIQEAFRNLGDFLDEMVATAPEEIVVQA